MKRKPLMLEHIAKLTGEMNPSKNRLHLYSWIMPIQKELRILMLNTKDKKRWKI